MFTQLRNLKPDYTDEWGTKYMLWKRMVDLYASAPMSNKNSSLLVVNSIDTNAKVLPTSKLGAITSPKKFEESDWFFSYNTYSDFSTQYMKIANYFQQKLHDLSLYYNQLEYLNGFVLKLTGYNLNPFQFFLFGILLLFIFFLSYLSYDPYTLIKRNFEARLYIIENFLSLRFNKGRDIIFNNKISKFYAPTKLTYPYYSLMTKRFGAHIGNNIVWSIPFPVEPEMPNNTKKEFKLMLYLHQKPICKTHDYWKPEYLITELEDEELQRLARKKAYQEATQKEYEEARKKQGL